jgi:hypothetical protein
MICSSLNRLLRTTPPLGPGAGHSKSEKSHFVWTTFRGAGQVEYQQTPIEIYRGIHVFNSETNSRIENRPFLHNAQIDARDKALNGNVRKAARFLKCLKYDADIPLKISSYDITAIAYNAPPDFMRANRGEELFLIENLRHYLKFLIDNPTVMQSLQVPNGMRPIFCDEGASGNQLKDLYQEVQELVDDINKELAPGAPRLAVFETRVSADGTNRALTPTSALSSATGSLVAQVRARFLAGGPPLRFVQRWGEMH